MSALAGSPRTARLAGPLLIVLTVLMVLHGFWLENKLTNQQVDILAFWLPRWSSLGHSLAAGHVPTWLPNQFGGVPFVSDPQSGWLYVPVMLLFSIFSPARAMGLFIVLQPILAGLGMYGFFRHEGLGRPAATIGGLALALSIAGSGAALSMPFAGTLAWTAMSLAGASGFLRARTTVALLGWLAFTGFAWSQIAAAHLTDGLLIGSAVLGLYVAARLFAQVRSKERSWRSALVMLVGLFAVLPLLSLAAILPRLALIPRTSIGLGYRELGRLSNRLSGQYALPPLAVRGLGPWWVTAFARGPGGYVGAVSILVIPVAMASRRWRAPVVAFTLVALSGWVLNLDRLIASPHIRSFALKLGIGELWLRDPSRFRYQVLIALAALAGYGVQAWLDRPRAPDDRAARRRLWWFAPALVVFVIGPLVAGAKPVHSLLFLAGALFAIPLLLAAARGVSWAPAALAGLLAVELTIAGIVGQFGPLPPPQAGGLTLVYDSGLGTAFAKLRLPSIDADAYLAPDAIGRALQEARDRGDLGRYLSFDERIALGSSRGFLSHQEPNIWPAYENGRSILFDIDEIQGYSPIQLDRYWRYLRAANTVPIFYNAAAFQSANPAILRLFGVEWVIVPTKQGPPPGPAGAPPAELVATEGVFSLYRLPWAEPRASMVYDVGSVVAGGGLSRALRPSFDPAVTGFVEVGGGPPSPPFGFGPGPGTADYHQITPEHAQVDVTTNGPGLLVIRNPYDPSWHAAIDGKPATILIADYLMQGVTVPSGTHVVDLTYRDRSVGWGLLASAVAWALLLGALLVAWLRRRPAQDGDPGGPGEGGDDREDRSLTNRAV